MKIRGTITGRTILLDSLPDLAMDQRVEVDITPVEDATEPAEAKLDETNVRKILPRSASASQHSQTSSQTWVYPEKS